MKDYNAIATGVIVFCGLLAFASILLDNYIIAGLAMCAPSLFYWGFGIFINILISKRLDNIIFYLFILGFAVTLRGLDRARNSRKKNTIVTPI